MVRVRVGLRLPLTRGRRERVAQRTEGGERLLVGNFRAREARHEAGQVVEHLVRGRVWVWVRVEG